MGREGPESRFPKETAMKSFIDRILIQPLEEVLRKIVAFLPSLLTGIVVFAAGLVLAWLVKLLVVRIIKLLKLDAAFDRSGVTEALQKMAVKDTPAKLMGRMFFWLVACRLLRVRPERDARACDRSAPREVPPLSAQRLRCPRRPDDRLVLRQFSRPRRPDRLGERRL
ncbi:MAG: hypothetical protein MZU79_04360 [Anaerotruncus sp.]|nr:hypothetical protein [Anaerotruncus sp.]